MTKNEQLFTFIKKYSKNSIGYRAKNHSNQLRFGFCLQSIRCIYSSQPKVPARCLYSLGVMPSIKRKVRLKLLSVANPH